jgi:hypothetical protein
VAKIANFRSSMAVERRVCFTTLPEAYPLMSVAE